MNERREIKCMLSGNTMVQIPDIAATAIEMSGKEVFTFREMLPGDDDLTRNRRVKLIGENLRLREQLARLLAAVKDLIEGRDWPQEKLAKVQQIIEECDE